MARTWRSIKLEVMNPFQGNLNFNVYEIDNFPRAKTETFYSYTVALHRFTITAESYAQSLSLSIPYHD